MTISSERTLLSNARPATYGFATCVPALQWPVAQPSSDLDYSLNISPDLADITDSLATVTVAMSPSGAGEAQLDDLSVQGPVITTQIAGGAAGRGYVVQITATSVSGRRFEYLIGLQIDSATAVFPVPDPPSAGAGTSLTWTSGVTVFGNTFVAVATGLVATGTNQATAAPLAAQTNVFATVAPGTGCVLDGTIVSGTFTITNYGANAMLVYPPLGAQIGSYGFNVPVPVQPNQTISFSTQSPATEWNIT